MEQHVGNFFKPVFLSLICSVSAFYLSKNISVAILIGLIPLFLGWLGVMQGFAYRLAIVIFLVACAWAITPSEIRRILGEHVAQVVEIVSREIQIKS